MDAYRRNGQLLDHKIKADEAVEQAEKNGVKSIKSWFGDGTRDNTLPRRPWSKGATISSTSCWKNIGEDGRTRIDAIRCAAVPDVYKRHDGETQGMST